MLISLFLQEISKACRFFLRATVVDPTSGAENTIFGEQVISLWASQLDKDMDEDQLASITKMGHLDEIEAYLFLHDGGDELNRIKAIVKRAHEVRCLRVDVEKRPPCADFGAPDPLSTRAAEASQAATSSTAGPSAAAAPAPIRERPAKTRGRKAKPKETSVKVPAWLEDSD